MKKMLKRAFMILLCASLCIGMFSSCSKKKKIITIYSTAEDFRIELARSMLEEKFPEYKISIEYKSTGDLAAKLAAEGKSTDTDIIFELETTYLEKLSDNLAALDQLDYSAFEEELVPDSHKYVPSCRLSGAIIVNQTALDAKGIALPTSYEDLLKEEYKSLISMPNPKSSGTGYIFLLNMVNTKGEKAAFEYFDKLAGNISGQGFTASGSGPVQALINGEADIALGMTFQAVKAINDGSNFKILFFNEGAPYTTYSNAVIAGKEKDADVMKVFNYLVSDITPKDKELYSPEQIYKTQSITMKNYPQNIPYGNMDGIKDITIKESLLDKWNH